MNDILFQAYAALKLRETEWQKEENSVSIDIIREVYYQIQSSWSCSDFRDVHHIVNMDAITFQRQATSLQQQNKRKKSEGAEREKVRHST